MSKNETFSWYVHLLNNIPDFLCIGPAGAGSAEWYELEPVDVSHGIMIVTAAWDIYIMEYRAKAILKHWRLPKDLRVEKQIPYQPK